MTLEQYLQQYYRPSTTDTYKKEIKLYINNFTNLQFGNVETARYKNIIDYIGWLRSRYTKPTTITRVVSCIKVYYDYLCHTGIRKDNPAKAIKLRDKVNKDIQLQDLFTAQELETLLHTKERYTNVGHKNKILISLLIYQALKPIEIEMLETTDINLQEGNIYIKETGVTNSRTLPLKSNQILLFHQYLQTIRSKMIKNNATNKLLIGYQGGTLKKGDIEQYIAYHFKTLYPGRRLTAGTIRQSVITNLLKQGHDISVVQSFAGHKRPTATERYKQTKVDTLQTAIQQYHPLK